MVEWGNQKARSRAAANARIAPNKNGADGPNPTQPPAPCQSKPAINEAGKSRIPMMALYVPYAVARTDSGTRSATMALEVPYARP